MTFVEEKLREFRNPEKIIKQEEREMLYERALASLDFEEEHLEEALEAFLDVFKNIDVPQRIFLDELFLKIAGRLTS